MKCPIMLKIALSTGLLASAARAASSKSNVLYKSLKGSGNKLKNITGSLANKKRMQANKFLSNAWASKGKFPYESSIISPKVRRGSSIFAKEDMGLMKRIRRNKFKSIK